MARNPFQWFPFYAVDWLSDERVRIIPLESQGAYIRLLASQWVEGSIPADDYHIARLLGIPTAEWLDFSHEVRQFFVEAGPGRLKNERLEREQAKQLLQHKRLSKAGKAGAEITNNSRLYNRVSGPADERPTATSAARPPALNRPGSGQLESESESESDTKPGVRAREETPEVEKPKPIGAQLAGDAELTRLLVRFTPDTRTLLVALTTDPITGKTWPHWKQVKTISEFHRFDPEVVNTASRMYSSQGHAGKGHRFLIALCEGGATEEVLKRRHDKAANQKRIERTREKVQATPEQTPEERAEIQRIISEAARKLEANHA